MIQININERNFSNLPMLLRRTTNFAFLQFLSMPVKRILNSLYTFAIRQSELASITGQVIYLEYILNRYFNNDVFSPNQLAPDDFNPNNYNTP